MKTKKILFMAAMGALFVSCSSEDVLKPVPTNPEAERQYAIGFSTWQNNMTRAASEDLEFYHGTFAVYGTKKSNVDSSVQYVFGGDATTAGGNKAGTTVTYVEDATAPNDWTYSPYRYWDKQAKYQFIAYAPAGAPLQLNYYDKLLEVGNAYNNFVTTAPYALKGQNLQGTAATTEEIKTGFTGATGLDCDMMVSQVVSEDGATHNPDVMLEFAHILAKFNVTIAKSKVLDDAVVTVKSFTIANLLNQGTFSNNAFDASADPKVSAWDNVGYSATPSTYVLAYNGEPTALQEFDDNKPTYFIESLVMPQTLTADNNLCTLKYSITTGTAPDTYTEDYTYTFDLETATSFGRFFDRCHYQLNILIDPTVITFDASVFEWDEDNAADHTVE